MRINWKKAIVEVESIVADFRGRGVTPTLRALFYALVSRELLPNTMNAYKYLSKKLVRARQEGFIRWQSIADDLRRTIGGDSMYNDLNRFAP
ncbi:MAG: hypothetical protein ACE5OY_06430 [Candidatus Bathyarchaeia archaeon]